MNNLLVRIKNFLFQRNVKPEYADLDTITDLMVEEASRFAQTIMDWQPSEEDILELRTMLPPTKEDYNNNQKIYFRMIQEQFVLKKFAADLTKTVDYLSDDVNNLSPEDKLIHHFQMGNLFMQIAKLVNSAAYVAIGFAYMTPEQEKYLNGYDTDVYPQPQMDSYTQQSLEDLFCTQEELDIEEFNDLVQRRGGIVGDA